jgi:hypothetical protein
LTKLRRDVFVQTSSLQARLECACYAGIRAASAQTIRVAAMEPPAAFFLLLP